MISTLFFGFAAILALTYGLFLLWLRGGLARLQSGYKEAELPSVSIIIAARNEEATLPALLSRLLEQDYSEDRYEIIIADDGSTDRTPEIAASFAARDGKVRILRIKEVPSGWAPKKWALDRAIEAAQGEIILATDADCLPGPQWIKTMVHPFADPPVGFVAGPAPLVSKSRSLWSEALFLDSCAQDALSAGGIARGIAITAVGRNLGYRKAVYHEVGGFQGIERYLSGDDDLIMHKIVSTGRWLPAFLLGREALVISPPVDTLKGFIQQRLRFASMGRHYFQLAASPRFKLVVPLIYLVNLTTLISLGFLVSSWQLIWLIPLAVKLAAEAALVYAYLARLQEKVRSITFMITGLLYPFYVVLFSTLGSFVQVSWKGRRYEGSTVSSSETG